MKGIYKKAFDDYLKLVDFVRNYKGTFEQLYNTLNGFNYSEHYESFDCNYETLTATVYKENDEFYVYRYIDIWDDNNMELVAECVDYVDLKTE